MPRCSAGAGSCRERRRDGFVEGASLAKPHAIDRCGRRVQDADAPHAFLDLGGPTPQVPKVLQLGTPDITRVTTSLLAMFGCSRNVRSTPRLKDTLSTVEGLPDPPP